MLDYNAQIVEVDHPEDQTATFWRYAALTLDYDYVLFRDVDSRPFDREFYAIDEWLTSHIQVHVMRDHPYHGVPMLAGLWGSKRATLPFLADLLPWLPPEEFYQRVVRACNHTSVNYQSNDFYQVDQWWLRLNVYPKLRNKVLSHDEFYGFERKRFKRRFPPRGEDMAFVGEGFDEFDQPRYPEHRLIKRFR